MAYSDKIKLSHEKIPFCISHFSNKRQYSTFRSRRDFIWRSSCWRYITIPRNVTNMIWISEKYGREYDRNMIFYFSGRGHSISPPPYSHQQCLTLLPEMKYFSIRKKRNCKKSELRWGSFIQELQKRTEMRPNIAGFAKIIAKNQNLLPETIMNWCRISKILKMGLCVMYCKKYSVYGFQEMRRVKNNPIVSWEMVWW